MLVKHTCPATEIIPQTFHVEIRVVLSMTFRGLCFVYLGKEKDFTLILDQEICSNKRWNLPSHSSDKWF